MEKKKILLLVSLFALLLVLCVSITLLFDSCNRKKTHYTKADVDSLIVELREALMQEDVKNKSALDSLKLEYDQIIATLEQSIANSQTQMTTLTTTYNDKIAELEATNAETKTKLGALRTEYEAALAELQKADSDNNAAIEALTKAYTDKVAELEAADRANSDELSTLKAEYEAELAKLQEAGDNNKTAIEALTKTYTDKATELEAADKATMDALTILRVEYEAKVAELSESIAKNEAAIADNKTELQNKIDELTTQHNTNIADIVQLILDFQYVDALNEERIAQLEAKINGGITDLSHTVYFEVDDTETSIESQTVRHGDKAFAPTAPTAPEGYIFDGWYVGNEKWVFAAYTITEDLTLTAKFAPIEYKITYSLDSSFNHYQNPTTFTIEDLPISLYSPSKDDSTFMGWYLDFNFENETVEINNVGNVTLYAKWRENTTGSEDPPVPEDPSEPEDPPVPEDPTEPEDPPVPEDPSEPEDPPVPEDPSEPEDPPAPENPPELVYHRVEGGYFVNDYLGTETEVIIPATYMDTPVIGVGAYAFANCTRLVEVVIPESVKTIESYAFYNCNKLTSILIPENVVSIGEYAFADCDVLEEIYYKTGVLNDLTENDCIFSGSGGDGKGIHVIIGKNVPAIPSWLFWSSYAPKIVSVEFEEGSICENIGTNAFAGCTDLESVTLPNSITSIGSYAFFNCEKIVSIVLPDKLQNINYGVFYNCKSLTTIVIPESVTRIDEFAFNCSGLTGIIIPDTVTYIGSYAFSHCSDLISVKLGKGITTISRYLFENCSSLKSIVIAESVTNIDTHAFHCSTKLKSILYCGTSEQWDRIIKVKDWDYKTGSYTITYNYIEE